MTAGELVHTPERAKINDLDTLPLPDREAIDHQKYLDAWRTHHGASSINLITARGCPYRCTWCSHAVYGYSHRRRSPENVAAEVAWIVERYNPDQVWYADDVFTISHPWLQKYKAALDARGLHLPFETITRADRLQSEEAVVALRDLGCYRIWIGSESGSQKILDAMQRGVSVEQVRRAVKLAQKHGIERRHVPDVGLRGRGDGRHCSHRGACQAEQSRHLLHHRLLSDQGDALLRHGQRQGAAADRAWANATDRDYFIDGRNGKDYYKLADVWLRSEVEASRLANTDPRPCRRSRSKPRNKPGTR